MPCARGRLSYSGKFLCGDRFCTLQRRGLVLTWQTNGVSRKRPPGVSKQLPSSRDGWPWLGGMRYHDDMSVRICHDEAWSLTRINRRLDTQLSDSLHCLRTPGLLHKQAASGVWGTEPKPARVAFQKGDNLADYPRGAVLALISKSRAEVESLDLTQNIGRLCARTTE